MVKFVVRRANEIGNNQCHGAFTKSDPTLHSDTVGYVAGTFVTPKTANITVTCR